MAASRTLLMVCFWLSGTTLLTALVPNLHSGCMKCLCEAATSCNRTVGCSQGYCGPFKVARVYWVDAGRPVMPEDVPERAGAYEDCARQYHCAKKMVERFMSKFGMQDCNGDGVTNCDDYAMIHYNGAYSCQTSIADNDYGRRYFNCRPPKDDSAALLRQGSNLRQGSFV